MLFCQLFLVRESREHGLEKGVILGGLKVSQQAGAEDASKGDADLAASWEGTFLPFLFYIYIHQQIVHESSSAGFFL